MTNVAPEQIFLTVASQFYLGPSPDTINIRQGIFVVATIGDLTVTTINGIPLPGGTFVTTTAAQTLSNKSLVDANTTFINLADATKQLRFDLGGGAAGTLAQISVNAAANRTYTIPDSGASASFVMTEGNQSINGVKTFLGTISFASVGATATSNQLVLGTGNLVTVSAPTPAASRIYTMPDVGANADFVMTEGNQSINGVKTFIGTISFASVGATATSNQLVLGTGATITINAPTPAASRVYTFPDVGTNADVVLTAGAQSIGGLKSFTASVAITPVTNQLVIGTGTTTTLDFNAPAADRVYSIPDVGANTSFVMSAGTQNISGAKTFSSAVTVTPTTNQLILGTGTTITINAATPGASRLYLVPDVGVDSTFAMLDATIQTFTGIRVFTNGIPITATTNQLILGTTNTSTITAPAPAASRVYTIADAGANASFVMTEGAQTIGGLKTFNNGISTTTANVTSTTNSTSRITGALVVSGGCGISGDVYSNSYVVETTSTPPTFTATTAGFYLDNFNRMQIQTTGTFGAFDFRNGSGTTYVSFNPLEGVVAGAFTMTRASLNNVNVAAIYNSLVGTGEGIEIYGKTQLRLQIFDGVVPEDYLVLTAADNVRAFKQVHVSTASDQIRLGATANTIILNAAVPAASRTYTLADVGANAAFVMTAGAQTVAGVKTFSNDLVVTSATASVSQVTGALVVTGGIGCSTNSFIRGVAFETSGGTPTVLDYFEETTLVAPFVGAFTSGLITLRIKRINNQVSIKFPAIQGVAVVSGTLSIGVSIPVRFQPATEQTYGIRGVSGGVIQMINARIGTAGLLRFETITGAAFPSGSLCGTAATGFSYDLDL